jgi:TusA-related sulfurtransferase
MNQKRSSGEILEVLFGQPPIVSNWEKWVKVNAAETP